MKQLVNILLIAGAILGLAWLISRYRNAMATNGTFTFDDILSSATQEGYGYKDGKCYQVKYNSITGQKETIEVSIQNCYKLKTYQKALKDEWTNIQNRLASIPNPNDPNDAQMREDLRRRANEIKNIFKQIYGCTQMQDWDMNTMACITPPQNNI